MGEDMPRAGARGIELTSGVGMMLIASEACWAALTTDFSVSGSEDGVVEAENSLLRFPKELLGDQGLAGSFPKDTPVGPGLTPATVANPSSSSVPLMIFPNESVTS
ncbi:hypothetical protein D3C81_1872870 [compost metagenome]